MELEVSISVFELMELAVGTPKQGVMFIKKGDQLNSAQINSQ